MWEKEINKRGEGKSGRKREEKILGKEGGTASRIEAAFGKAIMGDPNCYPIIVIHLLFCKNRKPIDRIQCS